MGNVNRNFCANCKDCEQRDGSLYCNDKRSKMYGFSVETVRNAPCFQSKNPTKHELRKEFVVAVCEAFTELNAKSETSAEKAAILTLLAIFKAIIY